MLKHIKISICKKKNEKELLSGVLDQIQLKIDELHAFEISKADQSAKPKVNIKQSYIISTNQFRRQVELLQS